MATVVNQHQQVQQHLLPPLMFSNDVYQALANDRLGALYLQRAAQFNELNKALKATAQGLLSLERRVAVEGTRDEVSKVAQIKADFQKNIEMFESMRPSFAWELNQFLTLRFWYSGR